MFFNNGAKVRKKNDLTKEKHKKKRIVVKTMRFCYLSVGYYPLIAAIPGRTLPSMASRRAPPPVEM